jgi:hypothetical protein
MQNLKYTLTLLQTCEALNKSKKTISRYVKQGKLNPRSKKSKRGTTEYRFNEPEVLALKEKLFGTPPPEQTEETRQRGQREVISILRETQNMLKDQLKKKDEQIDKLNKTTDSLIERNRETNLLIGNLQHQISMLKLPEPTEDGEAVRKKESFFKRFFKQ